MEKSTLKLPLSIVALNYVPVLYAGGLAALVFLLWDAPGAAVVVVLFWIYLLPPLVCRFVLVISGLPCGGSTVRSASFRKWWFLSQLQAFFNRFPVLEEVLRIIPACYSLWLSLWGSRVSPLVLWSPGVRITDRYLLRIDREAVLGWSAQLSPHLVSLNARGEPELILGIIEIGSGAVVGGHAVLGPGSRVYPGESLPATRMLGPFHCYRNGRRETRREPVQPSAPSTRQQPSCT